jgi:hypothetical protein
MILKKAKKVNRYTIKKMKFFIYQIIVIEEINIKLFGVK